MDGMEGCFAGSAAAFSTVTKPLGETYRCRYGVPQKGKSKSSVTRRILLGRPGVKRVCPVCIISFLTASKDRKDPTRTVSSRTHKADNSHVRMKQK